MYFYHVLSSFKCSIEGRNKDNINLTFSAYVLSRKKYLLAHVLSLSTQVTVYKIPIEMQNCFRGFLEERLIWELFCSFVELRLSMSYHECLGETLVTVSAVWSKPTATLEVVHARLNYNFCLSLFVASIVVFFHVV